MNAKLFIIAAACLLTFMPGRAVPQSASNSYPSPKQPARQSPGDDLSALLRQLKTGLADVKHELRNQESEIRLFENKLNSQETLFEHLRQQLTDEVQSQKDFARASNINLDGKTATLDQSIRNLETMVRGVTTDVRQIKTQANDSVAALGAYKQKISELETIIQAQGEHLQNLEAALHSMMEAWQIKEASQEFAKAASEKAQSYKVQPGDSLEKIARAQKISVQALKDANQLTSDRIIVGQTLKIP